MLAAIARALTLYVLYIVLFSGTAEGTRLDCCLGRYSAIQGGCSASGTVYDNTTYYCVSVGASCSSCKLKSNVSSSECSECCATSPRSCELHTTFISTTSWTLICIVFAGSCCCCSLVFLSAEHNRMKEGITFQEAYLLPIPLVTAELFDDMDMEAVEKDFLFPPDQPTAIARTHTNIDVVVAEPTEVSSLLHFSNDW